jgi:DNA-binding beta-propeller fold protein YncE
MPERNRRESELAAALDRHWDTVLAGDPSPADLSFTDLDPGLAATVQRVHALDVTPRPHPAFASVLWEDLMQSQPLSLASNAGMTPPIPLGADAIPDRIRLFTPPRMMSRVAAAMLVIALLAGSAFAALYPLRQHDGDGLPLFAPVGTPAAPAATAQALGIFEFLWESTGGTEPMVAPYGVSVDPQGNVWVADSKNDRFQIIAPDGTFLETWGESGSGQGQFDFAVKSGYPGDSFGEVAFDADGNIYVADTGNFRVQKFAPDRSFLLAWGEEGDDPGQFMAPDGIAVAEDGAVFVVDLARGDIQRFSADGTPLDVIGESGSDAGQFASPAGIAIAGNGNLWVADFDNNRVQQFSPNGEFLTTWGSLGSKDGDFHYPNDVAVDRLGRVYVADTGNNRIKVFMPDGRFLAQVGGLGTQPGQFVYPHGIAVDEAGVIYVTDRDRLQAFRVVFPQGDVLAS